VLLLSREYGGDLVAGMIASGHMTRDDFERSIDGAMKLVSTERLWAEIRSREAP